MGWGGNWVRIFILNKTCEEEDKNILTAKKWLKRKKLVKNNNSHVKLGKKTHFHIKNIMSIKYHVSMSLKLKLCVPKCQLFSLLLKKSSIICRLIILIN